MAWRRICDKPWASCQIRKIAGCACAGNAGNVFPTYRLQRKPQVSDPGMHHGTCVTHVPWCMSESLIRGGGENVPGIPGACATRNFAYLARGPLSEPMLTRFTDAYMRAKGRWVKASSYLFTISSAGYKLGPRLIRRYLIYCFHNSDDCDIQSSAVITRSNIVS